ncbi:MAG TPA: family 1 glycosylhydrolase [Noviherbaspirillum sp.]|jgi:dTDP-4-dehydrorhamnose reductase|uniref:family 1 glycosylhydrolase n=1 Tax=Noviherbaspirillum sp. TaxID=1926288 RepID=UPI002DDD4702|nr:family 1 glycosylhydrolase [Noviherbaspirillum sp.]HEV2610876.1 family 1 glycosylhydrolase [Noviherbaspirillum sp.]
MNQYAIEKGDPTIALWGGLECTVNRVRDNYFSQMERNGHTDRIDDLERFASLGIQAIRYPVLWERIAPDTIADADWSWPDQRLPGLQRLGVTPIVGLLHHGSGPRHTSLVDPEFADKLAQFAGAVARRYPWVEYYTPINEPLTTARFSGLYGVWYPHGKDDRTFVQALLNQCRAVVLSMRAIREVNPDAKLVQTDDISKTYSTPEMAELADFYNERRWLSWDLLCGKVGPAHALWGYLTGTGIDPSELLWFADNPCPPDIIGVNYYITSERWLDQRANRYPEEYLRDASEQVHADVHAARALAVPTPGISVLLDEAWERYGLPLAVTEAHIDANREDQLRWLLEIWEAATNAKRNGVDMRAVTVWALLGSYDWNCLVTECKGYYEPGPFDVRSPSPRPTAVASFMRELSAGRRLSHPVLQGQGWWRRPGRFHCPPVAPSEILAMPSSARPQADNHFAQPILITGATGTLGRAFARICRSRNLAYRLLSRHEMDIADPASVERAIVGHQPWAVINAGGYVRVDAAESDADRCFRENALGPSVLAIACIRHNVQLMTFSSDLVFDGRQQSPYIETDNVRPLNIYGRSKVEAERRVLDTHPDALVVRSSAFFGPWDSHNFLTRVLRTLSAGSPFVAANDMTVSPTYVPDLVHACLDLLIDKEKGVWHLTNAQPITWADLALKATEMAGIDSSRLETRTCSGLGYVAARPMYSALGTRKAVFLPSLEDAIARFLRLHQQATEEDLSGQAAHVASS